MAICYVVFFSNCDLLTTALVPRVIKCGEMFTLIPSQVELKECSAAWAMHMLKLGTDCPLKRRKTDVLLSIASLMQWVLLNKIPFSTSKKCVSNVLNDKFLEFCLFPHPGYMTFRPMQFQPLAFSTFRNLNLN